MFDVDELRSEVKWAAEFHIMRRGVMLYLFASFELVSSGGRYRRLADSMTAPEPGQRGIRQLRRPVVPRGLARDSPCTVTRSRMRCRYSDGTGSFPGRVHRQSSSPCRVDPADVRSDGVGQFWKAGLGNFWIAPMVSGRPGEAPAYAGTDFVITRDAQIAALYLFFRQAT